ncbi:MAG: hypothetical protein ACUVUR_04240 [bacterium]
MRAALTMIKGRCGFFLLLLIFCGPATVVWQRTIDSGTDERAVGLIWVQGGLVVIGNQGKEETGHCVWLVQRLDPNGNLLRRQTFAEGRLNILRDGCSDRYGNLLLGGYTSVSDTTICLIVKMAPDGRTLWKKGLASGVASWVNGVGPVDSNVAVCGGVQSDFGTDVLVCLLNPAGRTLWSRNYHFNESSEGWKVKADPNGNLVVMARFVSTQDILLMQLKPNGDTVWTRRYDSGGIDEPGGLAVDRFGNIVAVGTARFNDSVRCVILEYASDGGAVRKVAYGENTQAEGRGVWITEKGDVFVCGTLLTPKGRQFAVFEYVPGAVSVWERQIGAGKDADARAVLFEKDVFLAGDVLNQTQDIAVFRLTWRAGSN